MTSAFEGITPNNIHAIQMRFLAGALMKDVREEFSLTARQAREMRDEVFVPLVTNPAAVKALANGPMLNPSSMTKLPYARAVITKERQRANAAALTDDDKKVIRERHHGRECASFSLLGRVFDVHPNTIRSICKAD